MKLTVKAS